MVCTIGAKGKLAFGEDILTIWKETTPLARREFYSYLIVIGLTPCVPRLGRRFLEQVLI